MEILSFILTSLLLFLTAFLVLLLPLGFTVLDVRAMFFALHRGSAASYEFYVKRFYNGSSYYTIIFRRPGDWFGRRIQEWLTTYNKPNSLLLSYTEAHKQAKEWADDPKLFEEYQKEISKKIAAGKKQSKQYKSKLYKSKAK